LAEHDHQRATRNRERLAGWFRMALAPMLALSKPLAPGAAARHSRVNGLH
jgi:hypothetical protein